MSEKKKYQVAAYLRLSKGDQDVDGVEKSESNSITNQRLIIQRFIDESGDMELVDTYIDDGYTGTNFKRPELKRMMYDIDDGRINCVIVKDLSRFGRERIQTGQYITNIFKQKGVRFIAVGDHYDSLTANGSDTHLIMPIKALTNDSYSRDISMKVRSSQAIKRENGQFISAFAPYGYQKDPEDHNHLIIDEEAANVVRSIFKKKISGMSSNSIANELNAEGVMTPSIYKKAHGDHYVGNAAASKGKWTSKQVIRILQNEVYTGCLVQGKSARISYKVAKVVEKPKDEWITVKDTHEALVSELDFKLVQSLLQRDCMKREGSSKGYLFSGMLYCADCGASMIRKIKHRKDGDVVFYDCASYNKNGSCTRHHVSETKIAESVLKSMNHTMKRLCHYDDLTERLNETEVNLDDVYERDADIQRLYDELQKYRTLKSSLYQDLCDDLINEEQYNRYRDLYASKERDLQQAIEKQKDTIKTLYSKGLSMKNFVRRFKKNPHALVLGKRNCW